MPHVSCFLISIHTKEGRAALDII